MRGLEAGARCEVRGARCEESYGITVCNLRSFVGRGILQSAFDVLSC